MTNLAMIEEWMHRFVRIDYECADVALLERWNDGELSDPRMPIRILTKTNPGTGVGEIASFVRMLHRFPRIPANERNEYFIRGIKNGFSVRKFVDWHETRVIRNFVHRDVPLKNNFIAIRRFRFAENGKTFSPAILIDLNAYPAIPIVFAKTLGEGEAIIRQAQEDVPSLFYYELYSVAATAKTVRLLGSAGTEPIEMRTDTFFSCILHPDAFLSFVDNHITFANGKKVLLPLSEKERNTPHGDAFSTKKRKT